MIQRKQTLWLLLSALLMLVPLFFPYSVVVATGMVYEGDTTGFAATLGPEESTLVLEWPLMALNSLIILAGLVSIFLYRNRPLQMRVTVFNMLLKAGLYILAGITLHSFIADLGADFVAWRLKWLVSAVPLPALLLDFLSYRAIAVDEMTVRSMYRLRDRK